MLRSSSLLYGVRYGAPCVGLLAFVRSHERATTSGIDGGYGAVPAACRCEAEPAVVHVGLQLASLYR